MRYFYNSDVPMYMTRGIAGIDGSYVLRCMQMIEVLKQTGIEPDYLQVFRFSYDTETKLSTLKHSQEEPKYVLTTTCLLVENTKPFEGKIYIIDDETHRTVMFAEEY